jgi:hypothetical protein
MGGDFDVDRIDAQYNRAKGWVMGLLHRMESRVEPPSQSFLLLCIVNPCILIHSIVCMASLYFALVMVFAHII